MPRRVGIAAACLIALGGGAGAETVVDVPTRPGQTVRTLIDKPAGQPAGSVILIAGGHGNLSLGPDGAIGWGRGNQLVRSRAAYARAGFVTLVPDIAADLKSGAAVKPGYRWSRPHAEDLGALVAYARQLAQPVHLVGTSRGALSVASAAATQTKAPQRPDAIVITAGMLVATQQQQPSVERNVPGLANIRQPVLIVYHEKDGCSYTPPSSGQRFKPMLKGAAHVDIRLLSGGSAGAADADPCEAQSHHGFLGQDGEIVELITGWLKALPR